MKNHKPENHKVPFSMCWLNFVRVNEESSHIHYYLYCYCITVTYKTINGLTHSFEKPNVRNKLVSECTENDAEVSEPLKKQEGVLTFNTLGKIFSR